MGLTLITCTGGRPAAFALLEGWIARQSYPGDLQWIVVDDCDPETPVSMGQTVIRPVPRWSATGGFTLGRNICAALPFARFDKILFIEDDEAYLPLYLSHMSKLLDSTQLAGQHPARYYNVARRLWRVLNNKAHASLCQSGIRSELITRVMGLCAAKSPFIDIGLWQCAGALEYREDVVSIKGMPGRPGVGVGHRPAGHWEPDRNLAILREWLEERAELYAPYWEP